MRMDALDVMCSCKNNSANRADVGFGVLLLLLCIFLNPFFVFFALNKLRDSKRPIKPHFFPKKLDSLSSQSYCKSFHFSLIFKGNYGYVAVLSVFILHRIFIL